MSHIPLPQPRNILGSGGPITKRKASPSPQQPVPEFVEWAIKQAQQPRTALCCNWEKEKAI